MLEEAGVPVDRVALPERTRFFSTWIMDGASIASSPIERSQCECQPPPTNLPYNTINQCTVKFSLDPTSIFQPSFFYLLATLQRTSRLICWIIFLLIQRRLHPILVAISSHNLLIKLHIRCLPIRSSPHDCLDTAIALPLDAAIEGFKPVQLKKLPLHLNHNLSNPTSIQLRQQTWSRKPSCMTCSISSPTRRRMKSRRAIGKLTIHTLSFTLSVLYKKACLPPIQPLSNSQRTRLLFTASTPQQSDN